MSKNISLSLITLLITALTFVGCKDIGSAAGQHSGDKTESSTIAEAGNAAESGSGSETAKQAGTDAETEAKATAEKSDTEDVPLEIHVLDVGHGDSILIKNNGHYMLVDAGQDDYGTRIQLYLMKQGVDHLDYLMLTHPDADHIGSADVIVTKFDIDNIFMSEYEKDSSAYSQLLDALDNRNYSFSTPKRGSTYTLGDATFTILKSDVMEDSNDSSIVFMLTYNGTNILFMGDSEYLAEEELLDMGYDLDADVLKCGHHGSSDATTEALLEAVTPEIALISCELDGEYNHPHEETLKRLENIGATIYRTDKDGTIVLKFYGSDSLEDEEIETPGKEDASVENYPELPDNIYVGNKNKMRLHKATCTSLPKEENQVLFETLEEATEAGFTEDNECPNCKPFG